jgi:hypothetical protein
MQVRALPTSTCLQRTCRQPVGSTSAVVVRAQPGRWQACAFSLRAAFSFALPQIRPSRMPEVERRRGGWSWGTCRFADFSCSAASLVLRCPNDGKPIQAPCPRPSCHISEHATEGPLQAGRAMSLWARIIPVCLQLQHRRRVPASPRQNRHGRAPSFFI